MSLKSRYRNPATSTSESHRSVMCSYIIPNTREQSVVPFAQLRIRLAWRAQDGGGDDPGLHTNGGKIITSLQFTKKNPYRLRNVTQQCTVDYNKTENLLDYILYLRSRLL